MIRLFGIETEYGILVEGRGAEDLLEESRQVVRAYAGPAAGPWDYRGEDPRRDMRGYRVDHLSQNPTDAQYDQCRMLASSSVRVAAADPMATWAKLMTRAAR